jgi:phage gp16-like protein
MTQQTAPQRTRKVLLAQIHIARKDLGLDDSTYYPMIEELTGKDSAALMTTVELQQVIDHMRKRGWKNANAPARKEKAPFKPSDKCHVRKVWALWGALARSGALRDGTKGACRLFCERMTQCSDPEWLTPEQAIKVIEGLKAIERRHESARRARDGQDLAEPTK